MFKTYDQQQELLIPTSIREFLWKSHEAVLLNDVIDSLDLTSLLNTYKNNNWWTTAFHPKMLLKIIFYGYMNQTFSSRLIAKKLCSDLGFMYLAANNKPDFRTINRFRGERLIVVKDIFKQIVIMLKRLWVIGFWTVSLDGTKLYANASKENNYTEDWLDKMIERLLKEAEEIDEKEDEELWDKQDNMPEELADPEIRKQRIKESLEKINNTKEFVANEIKNKEKQGIKQERINTTDKDSRLMQMKHKDFANWYNAQIITENQIIITTDISNNACDVNELIPIIRKLKNEYKEMPENLLADAGYSSWDNYEYLEKENVKWYIPSYNEAPDLGEYRYDEINDIYKDKDLNIYKLKQYVGLIWRWRAKKWERLKEWEYKAKIYQTILSNWSRKFLNIDEKRCKYYKIFKKRSDSIEWKEILSRRKIDVETVFWNIKHNLKFTRFSLRWFKKTNIERDIACLAHNFKKMFLLNVM
jgi:transposase